MSQSDNPSLDVLAARVLTGELLTPSDRRRIAAAVTRLARAIEDQTTRPEALRIPEPLMARLRSIRDEAKRLCVRAYDGYPVDRIDLNDHAFRLEELVKETIPSPRGTCCDAQGKPDEKL